MRQRNTITSQERMARRAKAKEKPRTNYYQLQKYATLAYDYGLIDEAHREQVAEAAVEIHKWQRNTIELGKRLLAVKELLPHRQFMEWLQVEFDMSERMIQHNMNVARIYGAPEKRNAVTLLSPSALYLLAAPSTPEAAREVIEAQIAAGNIPTRAEVKRVADEYKPPKVPTPKQLTGPELHPDPIEAEYSVIEPEPAQRSPTEVAADLTLPEILMVLELAKEAAKRARHLEPLLDFTVTDLMPSLSRLIHKLEGLVR